MVRRGNSVAGTVLIVLGLFMLLDAFGFRPLHVVWNILLLVVGAGLLVLYYQGRRHPALLSAGVWLPLLGAHLLFLRSDWVSFENSWPFFIMAPGLALLAVAASDRSNRDALTPAAVLLAISALCYMFTLGIVGFLLRLIMGIIRILLRFILPLGLMAWGAYLVFGQRSRSEPDAGGPIPEKIEPEPVSPEPSSGLAADPGESLAELAEESTTSDEIEEEVQEGPQATGEDVQEPEEDEEPRS